MYKSKSNKDPYQFTFWLQWILRFAGSFVLASVCWTSLLSWTFGGIRGPELSITWALAVFGSWFLLVIPFMRKKEQIWKRLNADQEAALSAWLKAMGLFIGALIASGIAWSLVYKERILAVSDKIDGAWAKAVFSSWLVLLMPFLIWMYKKADQLYKAAFERQFGGPRFHTAFIEKSKRLLPAGICADIRRIPPVLRDGHILTLFLKDGRRIPDVFVVKNQEILGVYDRVEPGFDARDVVGFDPVAADKLPAYEESKWLRLDGRA